MFDCVLGADHHVLTSPGDHHGLHSFEHEGHHVVDGAARGKARIVEGFLLVQHERIGAGEDPVVEIGDGAGVEHEPPVVSTRPFGSGPGHRREQFELGEHHRGVECVEGGGDLFCPQQRIGLGNDDDPVLPVVGDDDDRAAGRGRRRPEMGGVHPGFLLHATQHPAGVVTAYGTHDRRGSETAGTDGLVRPFPSGIRAQTSPEDRLAFFRGTRHEDRQIEVERSDDRHHASSRLGHG